MKSVFTGVAVLFVLTACGGGGGSGTTPPPPPAMYAVGGTISGLNGKVVLQNNLGDDLTVAANGSFTFATTETTGSPYSVTVKTPPSSPSQTCVVGSGAGSIASAPVTTVTVTCTTNSYKIGGTLSGLTGSGLVLQDNAGDDRAVAANATNFTFATAVMSGAPYSVTVKTQPTSPAQTCTVASGSGTVDNADVGGVVVTCVTSGTGTACGQENGSVATHSGNITASETWVGSGTVHVISNPISISAPATVTIQPCAIVKLAIGAGIDVRGASTGSGTASLVAAGTDPATGFVTFKNSDGSAAPGWGRLRALNANSLIDLENTVLSGGGNVSGSQLNATISMNGSGVVPDRTLKVVNVTLSAPAGVGIYFSDAAFTVDSQNLEIDDQSDAMLAMTAMALGSVPPNTVSLRRTVNEQILVVENANITDNLTISTPIPIHFKTDGVFVGGLAPTFNADVTLTLESGVILMFERSSTAPPLVTFGAGGQSVDENAALIVHGTDLNPVIFTSALALPLVPGGALPAPGDWAGLWLRTSKGSQIDHAVIEYAGGDASIGPVNCGPFDPSVNHQAAHTAPLLVGDGTDQQYVPPAGLVTNSTFRNNTGNFAIDSVWETLGFGPTLTATNTFGGGPKFCTQSKNLIVGGCVVGGVDKSGCLVP